MFSTVSKTKWNTCVLTWLRSRLGKVTQILLNSFCFLLCGFLMDGRIQSAFPVTWGIKSGISFLSMILPFNVHSKYVCLTQEVSQPLSFNSFLGKTHTCLWFIRQHHPRPLSQPDVFISGLSSLLILFPLFSLTAYFCSDNHINSFKLVYLQ